jgi:hypothetical protein
MGSSESSIVPTVTKARRSLPVIGLSKSRYTAGLQCHKRLWWTVHEPDAPELVAGPDLQAVFDQGHRVGQAARERFPDGTLIDLEPWKVRERVAATEAAIASGASVVFEASFKADDVFVAVDVLHRAPGRRGWTITEVKSTLSAKEEHVADVAVQAHVVRAAGLPVSRAEVMHLNRECRHPDLSNLFVSTNVTAEVKESLATIPHEIAAQLRMLRKTKPPAVEPGPHCQHPWQCPFVQRCHAPLPEHAIETLHASAKKKESYAAEGYRTILDLPDDVPLEGIADRQRRAVRSGDVVVDEGVSEALEKLEHPIAHLDFETINPAIPVWPGCSPYAQVPVQFSVRIEAHARRKPREIAWLAESGEDPRPSLARALVDALDGTGSIIVYSASFESARLRELADAVPELARELGALADRLVDLLPLVRSHVYHPHFGGSFSLKSVAPALVPWLSYDDLEIGDGGAASSALESLLVQGEPSNPGERDELRKHLLAYCGRDTLATVGVLRRLRELAGPALTSVRG